MSLCDLSVGRIVQFMPIDTATFWRTNGLWRFGNKLSPDEGFVVSGQLQPSPTRHNGGSPIMSGGTTNLRDVIRI